MNAVTSFISKLGTNPTFIAFMAHAGFSYFLVTVMNNHGMNLTLAMPIMVALSAAKEFIFDVKYEGASYTDGLMDFAGYMAGMALAAFM